MLENDWELYLNKFEYYGFRIIFMKESPIWETKFFYPNYPWNLNFKRNYIFTSHLVKELIKIKKENFFLKKKIKYSLYRYVRRKK
jgi:hypothetical protein